MKQKIRVSSVFGDNIRRIRKEKKLTQEQVTAKLQLLNQDISRSAYAQIECGTYNIKVTELVALKKIYDVEYNEFFKDIEC